MNETTCGCCEGIEKVTPQPVANRPGLAALRYRVGTHNTFLESMLAALSSQEYPALQKLTTRETNDPAIALLDAGATLFDVLTFYQERIANEGFLRTATERRSILELARLIGYQLRPGVASSVYLAFTLEKGYDIEIPTGTRAQSIPGPGELPQSFETSEPLQARTEWNTLQPRLTRPQFITLGNARDLDKIYFQGTSTNLNPNDPLLLVFSDVSGAQVLHHVDHLQTFPEEDYTAVTLRKPFAQAEAALIGAAQETVKKYLNLEEFGVSSESKMAERVTELLNAFNQKLSERMPAVELAAQLDEILPQLREEHAIATEGGYARLQPWVGGLVDSLESIDASLSGGTSGAVVMAARRSASHNGKEKPPLAGLGGLIQPLLEAPSLQPRNTLRLARDYKILYSTQADTLPRFLTTFQPKLKGVLYKAWGAAKVTPNAPLQSANAFRVKAAPFGSSAPKKITRNSNGEITGYPEWPLNETSDILYLDAQYDQIKPDSWVIIERQTFTSGEIPTLNGFEPIYRKVLEVRTVSRAEYGISAKVTQLTLDAEWCQDAIEHKSDFSFVRSVTVYAQSEILPPADEPITEDVSAGTLELGELYDGLEPGRWVIVSGERTDIPGTSGVISGELVMLSAVVQGVAQVDIGDGIHIDLPKDKIHTTLQFANALAYTYKRDTVTVYGNVVKATHGETRQEVLGSGDASRALQTFTLKQAPLTFTSAPTPSGIESTLGVRVNDVRWPEVEGLVWLGPNQRGYITKTDDESKTSVIFGDGQQGARLPSGQENVRATYRFGIGKPGNVSAEQISLLATRPLGVKSVINPLPATGGADREDRDQARENAPLAVMALDRLVSVQDYADFARTFAGVGKASAARLSDGRRELVHVTIAGADDIPIAETSDLYQNLHLAFQQFNGDPFQPVQLAVRKLKLLVVVAKVRLLQDYEWESVEPQIRAAMLDTFSFARRKLGEDVVSSQVISTIQAVEGVAYVDLDVLDAVSEDADLSDLTNLANTLALNDRIPVHLARLDPDVTALPRPILPAQLAYLSPEIPDTLILTELTS
jgi:hypothetical protein